VVKRPPDAGIESEARPIAASVESTKQPTEATPPAAAPPKDKLGVQLVSYTLPYLLVLMILGIGAYIFYRAARSFIYPLEAEDIGGMDVAKNVIAIALLLFGVTAASRIPRLTRLASWRAAGALLGVATAALYVWSQVDVADISVLGRTIPSEMLVLGLTSILILIAYFAGSLFPRLGIKPLVIGGVIVCTIYLAARVIDASMTGPLWPVAVAMIVLLYLWWLGALLFDLAFVWHLYIRNTRLQERIDALIWNQVPPHTSGKRTALA
jgi:hypothetical protein